MNSKILLLSITWWLLLATSITLSVMQLRHNVKQPPEPGGSQWVLERRDGDLLREKLEFSCQPGRDRVVVALPHAIKWYNCVEGRNTTVETDGSALTVTIGTR